MSTPETTPGTLLAACANCASWRTVQFGAWGEHRTATGPAGACVKGLAPAPGEPRCDRYQVSAAFERLLVSRLMQDPAVVPIPLRGKAAKEARRRQRKAR